jgi:hypothetical protein
MGFSVIAMASKFQPLEATNRQFHTAMAHRIDHHSMSAER